MFVYLSIVHRPKIRKFYRTDIRESSDGDRKTERQTDRDGPEFNGPFGRYRVAVNDSIIKYDTYYRRSTIFRVNPP